ncbi:MAG TPA: ABC transporter permease [Terracidiphilus sp.]|jgi:predicted permease|nr:ABC transporter permease [Terracidiphilus sp.]
MGVLFQDLRFALRQLGRAPSFTVTAVLTLALGIGANAAIFSLVNSFLLKPLPVENPQQIATLTYTQNHGPLQRAFSSPEFKAIRAQSGNSFSDILAVSAGLDGFATAGQQPERITTVYVSGDFFSALGVQPAAGRLFLRSEGEVLDRDPVLVLGYDFWQKRFNGDPNVVGRQVTVDGHTVSVIGVAPKGFYGFPSSLLTATAYLPLSQLTIEGTPADVLKSWQTRNLLLYGRLRPGVSLKQASAGLNVVAQDLMRQHPDTEKQIDFTAWSERSLRIAGGNPNAMYVISALFLSLAGMVLLLACVNVANLVLVRATVREREMAIRAALGAQRSRLFGQMLTESVTLALIGGSMGVLLGMWASTALSHVDLHLDIPISLSFQFDWRIFFYSFAMALLAGIVVGMAPALRISKTSVNAFLHEGSRGVTAGRHWLRDSLVVLQISGSLVLLVVSGLFVRSLAALQTTDFGFKPDHVLNLSFDTSLIGLNDTQARTLRENIQARLHQLAGVDAVSVASEVPMGYFSGGSETLSIDGVAPPANAPALTSGYNVVSSEYFGVMGIDLLRGRNFTNEDNERGRDVAVISESTARKYWPNQDALGRTFSMESEKERKLEVVGIARDVEASSRGDGKSQPYFYLPYAQHLKGNSFMTLQVKTQGDPLALTATVERTIHSLAPQLPVFQVQSMHQALYSPNGLLLFQFGAVLAAIMGGLGLTLAVIGIYGIISYAVSQRVHEIGLRMALGATRGSVFGMIYRQSMRIVAVGLGIGLVLALLVARAVGSLVLVSAWDPATFATVVSALGLAALASCYLPARRAMAVDPMVALRQD